MPGILAINGSPRMENGNTALLLNSFIQGISDGGSEVELFYASRLNIKPCSCGKLYCWNQNPGNCCVQDGMQSLYPKLKAAEMIILATPVYIPLPGDMQNILNRLCALIDPDLQVRQGRTRAVFRKDVNIKKFVLVATSGWWELENFDTVVRIVKEIAEDAGVEFGGAVLRPHATFLKTKGIVNEKGGSVLDAAKRAGTELITQGGMSPRTLVEISRPLICAAEFYQHTSPRIPL
jgi:multimeric flavodoxin WrbA